MSGNFTAFSLDHLSMPGTTFYIVYGGFNDVDIMSTIARSYEIFSPGLSQVMIRSRTGGDDFYGNDKESAGSDKIKVGFASHYFRQHSVCKLICGVIHNLSDKFHVTVFSSAEKEDEWTEYILARADRFVRVPEGFLLKNRHIAAGLDLLVYPDIGMNPGSTVWAHSRLAPTQICFWGHPVTTGLPQMDYFITSQL